jgi:hypothetical protein
VTPRLFLQIALAPALSLLPPLMDSDGARAMVLAICLQESGLAHRQQIGGPARSYAQFERGGVAGVLAHPTSSTVAAQLCARLDFPADANVVYAVIGFNDIIAAAFARLLLWTSPLALPTRLDAQAGWRLYVSCWRPGKPRPETWADCFARAWEVITEKESIA